MFYVEFVVNFGTHIGCDSTTRDVLTIRDIKQYESTFEIGKPIWVTNDITYVGMVPDEYEWLCTVCRYDRYPTLTEIHIAMILNDKQWLPAMIDGTKEMETLHKMLWEV